MTQDEVDISLKMPALLVEKLDIIANQKYLTRSEVIIDACVYYSLYHDMSKERFSQTTRNILFDLARHDDEFRRLLREALRSDTPRDANNSQ